MAYANGKEEHCALLKELVAMVEDQSHVEVGMAMNPVEGKAEV
jgi:hypothetical protein